jgi:hypothetical protein
VRVESRAGAQDELGLARAPRMLGVAIERIILWRQQYPTVVSADDPSLCEGFHAYEADNAFRWTDGNALLPASLLGGVTGIDLVVAATTRSPLFHNGACRAA